MKPAEEKLCENNLDAIITFLKGLQIVRDHSGYGSFETKVQNDLVMIENITIQMHVPSQKKIEHRA